MSTVDAAGIGQQSLGSKVQAALEALIWDGTLPPGARLNEVTLARQLGVSRGPVREAARALERTGLVTVILNRGAFVRTLGIDEAMQIYEFNSVMFGYAASRLAIACTGEQAMTLRALVDQMDVSIEAGDRDAFFAGNTLLHESILSFAGNSAMEAVYLVQTRKLLLLRRRSFDRSGSMVEANIEHRRLLDSILAGDAALARQQAEAHTRSGRARFLTAIAYQEGLPPATVEPARTGSPRSRPRPVAPDKPGVTS